MSFTLTKDAVLHRIRQVNKSIKRQRTLLKSGRIHERYRPEHEQHLQDLLGYHAELKTRLKQFDEQDDHHRAADPLCNSCGVDH